MDLFFNTPETTTFQLFDTVVQSLKKNNSFLFLSYELLDDRHDQLWKEQSIVDFFNGHSTQILNLRFVVSSTTDPRTTYESVALQFLHSFDIPTSHIPGMILLDKGEIAIFIPFSQSPKNIITQLKSFLSKSPSISKLDDTTNNLVDLGTIDIQTIEPVQPKIISFPLRIRQTDSQLLKPDLPGSTTLLDLINWIESQRTDSGSFILVKRHQTSGFPPSDFSKSLDSLDLMNQELRMVHVESRSTQLSSGIFSRFLSKISNLGSTLDPFSYIPPSFWEYEPNPQLERQVRESGTWSVLQNQQSQSAPPTTTRNGMTSFRNSSSSSTKNISNSGSNQPIKPHGPRIATFSSLS